MRTSILASQIAFKACYMRHNHSGLPEATLKELEKIEDMAKEISKNEGGK